MSRQAIEARKPVERVAPTSIRLDKFLKISRIIKRRTVANEAADAGRITVNGKIAKPSAEVKVGDVLEIRFGAKTMRVLVETIAEHARKEDAALMYTLLSEEG